MADNSSYTLIELLRQIKETVNTVFSPDIWVRAEINNITEASSGHCYLELIQKAQNSDAVIAQCRASIWSTNYSYIKRYFESITKTEFKKGIIVLVKVSVDFHEKYGFSLNIRDIDPNYTVGDLVRQKNEVIEKLKKDKVFDMNKSLELPLVIQSIAIISSATAAGYEDFVNHITKNKYNLKFNLKLFQADMQGAKTEETVIMALDKIFEDNENNFDIVAIIRGGGSKTDLSYFDNYNIANSVAQFPIPVFSGIGHDRDESVVDMVSNSNFKTPTAVADFIIENNLAFENYLESLHDNIVSFSQKIINDNNNRLVNFNLRILKVRDLLNDEIEKNNYLSKRLLVASKDFFNRSNNKIEESKNKLKLLLYQKINDENNKIISYNEKLLSSNKNYFDLQNTILNNLEMKIKLMDPQNILKRGFSISKINGKVISAETIISSGDILDTITADKTIESIVI